MTAVAVAPRLRVSEIRLYEREVRLRMPFRYGVVTLTRAPQAFVRVRVALQNGREGWGMAAEMLAPKWFDKNLALTDGENFEQLRTSLRLACGLYTQDRRPRTAWELFAQNYRAQVAICAGKDLNSLIAGFGPALLDRAVLDALCRLHAVSFYDAVRANLSGIRPADLVAELAGFDMDGFLSWLRHGARIHARHTVGLVDPITAADQAEGARVGDGLPETLEEVVSVYGHTYFKLKVSGAVGKDIARLSEIAAVLDRSRRAYYATLDGNEQY
ncbi:MAG: mandelate racemase, partial [Candidatus Rokubacteria bacterium]|nr:mandelate racemase [Candidatus Rokubacteria bacterium]